jgi:hypothetical protein
MKTKNAAAGNAEDDLYRSLSQHLSRETARAQVDALFGGTSVENRKKDRAALEQLFVQTPAAQIQTPSLLKEAYEIKPEDRSSIPKKQFAQPGKEEAGHKGKYPIPDAQHYRTALGFAKMHGDTKAYAAIKAKGKAMGYGEGKEKKSALASLAAPVRPAESTPLEDQAQALLAYLRDGDKEKTSSAPIIAPSVDAYFEKISAPDEAQQRYPELLKIAQKPAPTLKIRDTKTQNPVRSDLSGGSA